MKKAVFTLLLTFTLLIPAVLAKAAVSAPGNSAGAAIVVDAFSGSVVYEKNADQKMKMASTTKILTALVALENSKPDDAVTIKTEWTGIEGSSLYLTPGEKLTMRDLVYGLLLESGNDAAVAIAGHVAGGVPEFAEMMNAKAAELGCENSHFVNPHGLDADGHVSTARDLALIMRAAMENNQFAQISGTKYISAAGRSWKNHNRLLWDYTGILGGKTGYTKSSGRSLVTCAERGGMRFICVTLSDPDDWKDHTAMYEWAFGAFECVKVTRENGYRVEIPVISGVKDKVYAVPDRDYSLVVPRGSGVTYVPETTGFAYAVVVRGGRAGTLIIRNGDSVLAKIPLVYSETVLIEESNRLSLRERFKRAWYMANEYGGYYRFGMVY